MRSLTGLVLAAVAAAETIPRTWNAADVATLEAPLAHASASPRHISEEVYYRIPERVLYKTYPVYHPDREPKGYMDWLRQQEPQTAFDASALRERADWIRAGEIVFNAPTSFGPVFFGADDVRDREFYKETGMPVAADGTVPFARWVVRAKGKVELGSMGCNTCHVRVMADGVVVPGAQGNNPGDRQGARMLRRAARVTDPAKIHERVRGFARQFEMPWLRPDPNARAQSMSLDELIAAGEAIPPGVTARSNTSMFVAPQIPDLIGVAERRHLDHTGIVRHRSIGDLMRYSSLVQDIVGYAGYGGAAARTPGPGQGVRYSDAQLYALALYLYSLEPPLNPNKPDAAAARGKRVFERERCGRCHTAPLYTNNKLIAAARIGTDRRYTFETRKGTGFYKVPSLKGVWYRGPFEHNGRAATLEEWFDPARLTRAPGHEFGLKLTAADKTALLAFLRTL